jgi:hypothetical protein
MRIALVGSTRTLITAMTGAALFALYSGCSDQSSERRGGSDIPDLEAGSGTTGTLTAGAGGDTSDAAGASGAAGSGSDPVP